MFLCSPVTCVFVIVAVNGLLGSYVLTDRNVYNKLVSQSGSDSAATVPQQPRGSGGLWPGKVNVAARARVWANATCGERRGEEFCRLATGGGSGGGLSPRGEQCAVCDARSSDPNKRHLAAYAVDGDPTRWWQSPTLQQGAKYQWVTFTLDLKQDYHISDVIVKAGPSPRPGNWVLERSRDGGGDAWLPWHYFAISDDECWAQYGVRPAPPQPTYKTDSEVVCTSYYSKIKPLEGGEIHTNLVSGRPRVNATELDEFMRARYVRLRLQKVRASADLLSRSHRDASLGRRLFYSIRDIIISGQCICHGHASKCKYNDKTAETQCECEHNTCGGQCQRCCPLFNQEEWQRGGASGRGSGGCERCQCHGHASSCHYDAGVARAQLSLNVDGAYRGGGVCDNCTDETTGINCEQCKPGWFRPSGVSADAVKPCVKCDCHTLGSTGLCANDDSLAHLGKPAGACECHEGFGGVRCDQCAAGFQGFPDCQPCPCDHRGVALHSGCDNGCQCKDNVEGERCDKCKPGFFLLDRDNPKGCMECYCSGVSSQCEPASGYKLQEISTLQGWLVSDIWVKRTVLPSLEPETGLVSIGNFELPGVENYFWLAGDAYCGDRLASYGSALTFRVTWVVMRGDTSGTPTQGPDVVILGNNGLKLGFGENWYQQNNISLTVQLEEQGWYHLVSDEADDVITSNRFGFKGAPVTRAQFLSVLADVKHILLRAKFHTDQAEASLVSATLETGDRGGIGPELGHLEQCACPEGYQGLSCQSCAFGYTRIAREGGVGGGGGRAVCSKCNCHSHAATCHPLTGECATCEHNTTGAMCERCSVGYYGNAQLGRHDDCRRCACPLAEAANNFSPTCEMDSRGGYLCTQCPLGYQGIHCQECAPGYFGNPMIAGSSCEPCECKDGGPCDQLTGQCLRCHGNTEGWRCERCKPAHYGDAQLSDCKPCECDAHGSVDTSQCNEITGQCQCKERYVGRSCNQCQDGLGNVTAGCVTCQCDEVGSVTSKCDPVTGHCQCHPGVSGPLCDRCLPDHYLFSTTGCQSCDCDIVGSKSLSCDLASGDCECKDNVIGRTCNTCQPGFWGLSEAGCQPCACDPVGSLHPDRCDAHTGQCQCKPGVEGRACEKCAQLFYGLSTYGCSECDICDKPGHICDPDTGRCVCPPFTEGPDCSRCQPNSWGFAPGLGCKPCNCDMRGSLDAQCNLTSGACACAEGFEGTQCVRCARGFYAFPACRACECDAAGTRAQHCVRHDNATRCSCDAHSGQCPCKDNVTGERCSACAAGTFGLDGDLAAGCLQCFCFGRSAHCSAAGNLVWQQLRTPHPRTLLVDYDSNSSTQFAPASSLYPVNTREICYINLAVPGGGEMSLNGDDVSKWNVTNNLRIIPGDLGDVEIGVNFLFDSPLYWQLPELFLNDKILSYGGFLRFTVETEGSTRLLPPAVLATYPLVQIQGNNKIILEHFPILHNPSSRHEVRFHESLWKMKNNPSIKVTRQMLMIGLQNLQHILIRATDTVDFSTALLRDVTLDTAVASSALRGVAAPPVGGVEMCACPAQYNATSCQNPSLGFYRYKGGARDSVSSTIFIQLVGEARPCECNNRSSVCDIETGHCLNCADSTGGERCERCAEGHYGDPERGTGCLPCPCPAPHHNNALSCQVNDLDPALTKCHCRPGYTGKRCERCSYGWFGYPEQGGGACVQCECNPHGSVSDECHEQTGQCNCRPGITGRDCSQCQPRHILTPKGCTSCDDGCTGLLLDKLDHMEQLFADKAGAVGGGDLLLPPWHQLMQADAVATDLDDTWRLYDNTTRRLAELPPTADEELHKKARQLLNKAKKLEKNCHNTTVHALVLKEEADVLLSEINGLEHESKGIVSRLQSYGLSEGQLVSVVAALKEARQHLARIRDTDMQPNAELTMQVLTYCNTTLNELKEKIGDKERLNSLKERLNKLLEQIADMKMIVTGVMGKSNEVIKLNDKNRQMYKNVGKTVELSLGFEEDVAKLMRESTDLKNLASVMLGEAEDNIEALRRSSDDLKVLTKAVEEREGILFNLNPAYKEKYVIPAQQHASNLMDQAQKYAELFVPTRQDADFALKASKAYEDIVSALESAKQAARSASAAADIAHEQAYPGIGRDSLVDDASATGGESRQLLQAAKDQLQQTTALHEQLQLQQHAVDALRRNVTAASLDDNHLFRQLHKLNSDQVTQTADSTLSRTDELTETAAKVKETADDIKKAVLTSLKPQLDKLEGLEDISLNSAKDMISESQDNVKKAEQLLSDIASRAQSDTDRFNAWNESVSGKLEALRNKITQARHLADGIRLSLTSKGERGSCIRTYQPSHLEPTTMTSIVLTYAISSQQRDALLFYLPSTTTDDFVAIEMVNRKMRFVWNMGGGVGEVTHPMHIQTAGDLSQDQHWYRVEAERISNVGRLVVRPQVLPAGSSLPLRPVQNASTPGLGRLDVRRGDLVWVGGLPSPTTTHPHPHPSLLSTHAANRGLVGCLHRLTLDGRPIGLWNFRGQQSQQACTACIEGAEEVVEEQAFSFSGDSYAVLTYDSSSAYNKYVFSVSLSFRTLDENALLFHAVGDHPERYISLTVREGRVVFRISYGGEWTLETRTHQRYNTGNWTRLEASRYYDRKNKVEKGVLKVDEEVRDGSPQRPPSQDAIPDLSGARFFFGGLPPGYHPPPSLLAAPPTTSFLGCMSDVQVMQEGYNLLKGKFWAVQPACSAKPLTVAGFHGDGYLQLASHHLKRKASFGFVFATAQQNALLMLSTFEGLDAPIEDHEEFTNTIEQEQDRLNYYTASLRRGQIEVRLNAGRGEVRLASSGAEYGDGSFHSVAVAKTGRRLELRVDDVVQSTATLPEGATIVKAPPAAQGGLYFGGLPAHLNTTGRTVTNVPLVGTIKDAIFNDQLLHFDQPVSFHHAQIGRLGPSGGGGATAPLGGGGSLEMAATMPTHEGGALGVAGGCRKVSSYSLQPAAVKFGDTPNTHVQMNLRKRAVLQKNYTLELHFRTYYPDGLIFIVPGTPQKRMHYMMGALRNGRLQIVVKGRRKTEMTAQAVLNDGAWHHMILEKEDRKMTLSVDSIDPEKTKTPKKMNIGPIIYLGGIPEGATTLPESLVSKLPSFKGCMQGMKLNGHMEDLVGDKVKSHKVGQCFPQVERGSYFPGDAYAIYEKKFNVGNLLELELEFRTSEMNGILLSVSQPENYPSLSLELHNGKVVMQGDMGDRRPFVVEQALDSQFGLCDNRWHRIEASLTDNDQLTLRVDQQLGQKYWLSDNGHLTATHTNSPLYIGGLPDQASAGMLRTRENFKGCIRNVMIGGERRDWTQMAALHNILLGSCPLPS